MNKIVLLTFSLCAFLVGALAEESRPEQGKKPEAAAKNVSPPSSAGAEKEQAPVVTQHSITIGGKVVSYTASAGYLLLKEEVENPGGAKSGEDKGGKQGAEHDALKSTAKMFFVAYTKNETEPTTRPVTFAFNGGPGAASVWLHLGALGPRRIELAALGDGTPAPYHLVDNSSSWLDETDLVFIDPVSTGYSRPALGEAAKSFHNFEDDLKSVAAFIREYITQNNRWLSPKYLVGESYGGTRAAALAGLLQDKFDIYPNGIVIVSGVLNWQTIDFQPGNDLPYRLFLPAYASTAWYHKKLPAELQQKSGADLRRAAEQFAATDYLLALEKGDALGGTERSDMAARIATFTGLPVELIMRYNLRVPAGVFMDELLKKDERSVGRFDSRITGLMTDPDGSNFDPSFSTMRGNFTAAINAYLRSELHFETELPYRSLANVSPWNFGNAENRYLDVADSLRRTLIKNPHLRVWVLASYYDLAISYFSTDYTLRQMRLAPELKGNVKFSTYESGHMLYTDLDILRQFKTDFQTFLSHSHPGRP